MPAPDGILAQVASREFEQELASLGIPVVNVSNALDAVRFSTVVTDDIAVGRMAGQYFLDRGYRRFLYISRSHHYARLRGRGFWDVLRDGDLARPRRSTTRT